MTIIRISALVLALVCLPLNARGQDDFNDFEHLINQKFEQTDRRIEEQYERVHQAIQRAFDQVSGRIGKQWGQDAKLPGKKAWVAYDEDLSSRAVVDYESGTYTLETLVDSDEEVAQGLQDITALSDKLLDASDSELDESDVLLQAIEEEIAKENIAVKKQKSQDGEAALGVVLPTAEIKVAQQSLKASGVSAAGVKSTVEAVPGSNKKKVSVTFEFANGFRHLLIEEYLDDLQRLADEYHLQVSTLLAIIETESSFNPRATSPTPAFGLMQIVPKTAGIDAYNHVFGENQVVSADYLYDELNNIVLGSAYFYLLENRYLKRITNTRSRFYCAVASYNIGVGNLARTFTGTKSLKSAVATINRMSDQEVYDFLLARLSAEETRNYLRKIVSRVEKYKPYDRVNT